VAKKSKEEVIEELKKLDNELGVLNERDKLLKQKCKVCGLTGCDVLSFKHRGPVHTKCITSSENPPGPGQSP
jgi:hypothetical protein